MPHCLMTSILRLNQALAFFLLLFKDGLAVFGRIKSFEKI